MRAPPRSPRRTHPHDRRIRTLWLTDAARPILEQVMAVRAEVRAQAMAGITEADQETLLDLLMTVRGNLAQPGRGWPGAAMGDRDEVPQTKVA